MNKRQLMAHFKGKQIRRHINDYKTNKTIEIEFISYIQACYSNSNGESLSVKEVLKELKETDKAFSFGVSSVFKALPQDELILGLPYDVKGKAILDYDKQGTWIKTQFATYEVIA